MVDWSTARVDLAICDCGEEFLAKIHIPDFSHFETDRPCPRCLRSDRVHEVVYDEPIPRTLHFLGKLFSKKKK